MKKERKKNNSVFQGNYDNRKHRNNLQKQMSDGMKYIVVTLAKATEHAEHLKRSPQPLQDI